MKYQYLKDALREFSIEEELTMEEYHYSFQLLIDTSPDYRENLKKEILVAISDPDWDWQKEAEEAHFIAEKGSSDSIQKCVEDWIWKVVAPNEKLSS